MAGLAVRFLAHHPLQLLANPMQTMLKLGLVSALLAATAIQTHAQESAHAAIDGVASAIKLGELGDIVENDNEVSLSSGVGPDLFYMMNYPLGVLADAQYKLNFEVVKTKSDVGPARYNVNVDGACAQYTPGPRTYTYFVPEGYASGSYYMGSGYHSNDGESDTRSWIAVTETYTPHYPQIACSGAYQADYSDSVSQYTKTVEYASQYPGGIFGAPFTAFEDNQPPVWYSRYSSGHYSDRSGSDYDISKPTPTGYGPTSSAPVTPTPQV